jgi:acetyl-CoA C-acetyltransferase
MREVFIVEPLRTPFGSFGGQLADVEAHKLAAEVIKSILARTKVDPAAIEQVMIGQVLNGGLGQAPARQAMRAAGLPDATNALTIGKVCGSGLMSTMLAATAIRAEESELIIAGGMENMSAAPYFLKKGRNGFRMGHGEIYDMMIHDGLQDPYSGKHMGEVAEAAFEKRGLTREEQDVFAIRSYKLSQTAVQNGIFADEIVPVVKTTKTGEVVIDKDEEPFKVDFDKLTKLRPVFAKTGTITAANASTINDGAALALVASEQAVKNFGLKPSARIVAQASHSMHPDDFTLAPIGAIQKVLQKAKLKAQDIDLFEINEAFAGVPLLAMKELGLNGDKVNVNGGACSIGHPIGASGGRLTATVIRELARRKARFGLATLCIGGGEAVAVIYERM